MTQLTRHFSDKCDKYRYLLLDAENKGDLEAATYYRHTLLKLIKKYRMYSGMREVA